ncbi:MAG: sulfotransferase family protein [Rhizobiaceae bacterium]|nr:sulfotransferase family protein [Rhizobiaceae bacterium]
MTIQYKNFIYNEERKFIFAYVPKVACTNWKSLMRYMAGYDDWLDNKLAHDKVNGGLRYLDFGNPSDYALLKDPGIKKYTMVRDPYSRVLSAYLNKIENRLPPQAETDDEDHFRKVVRDIDGFRIDKLGSEAYPEITLEVFLLWLQAGESWFTKDEHWAPQSTLLQQPEIEFDYVGRFETLPEDAPLILHAMGCSKDFPTQNEVNFAPTDANSKVSLYFMPETVALVDEIFANDFRLFRFQRNVSLGGVEISRSISDA